jgi:hypothetical protein
MGFVNTRFTAEHCFLKHIVLRLWVNYYGLVFLFLCVFYNSFHCFVRSVLFYIFKDFDT